MKQQLRNLWILCALLVLTSCAWQQNSQNYMLPDPAPDISNKLSHGWVQGVDNFLVIIDSSASMYEPLMGTSKLNRARGVAHNIIMTVPLELRLTGGLRYFGPQGPSGTNSELIYGMGPFDKRSFVDSMTTIRNGGLTPIALPLTACAEELKKTTGKIAVILISDGLDNESDPTPIEAVRLLKKEVGNRLCLHTVLIGEDPAGRRLLSQIADSTDCGSTTDEMMLDTSSGLDHFVTKVFLAPGAPMVSAMAGASPKDSDKDGVYDQFDACPNTPRGAKVDSRGCRLKIKGTVSISLNVEFDTNKAEIRAQYHDHIREVADFLTSYPDTKAEIEGHTDNRGSARYNKNLSMRRAASVRQYLIDNFQVAPGRLSARGYGFDQPIASNNTETGRQKNRRVVATITAITEK
jgi:OOP family OmpA-OmpF porin